MTQGYLHSRRRSRAISTPEVVPVEPELPLWRRVVQPPDPLQMDAGAEGELLVARVRTVLILLLLPIPIINLALDPANRTYDLGVLYDPDHPFEAPLAERMIAGTLPADRSSPVPGGHDWGPWLAAWEAWLDRGLLPSQCNEQPESHE